MSFLEESRPLVIFGFCSTEGTENGHEEIQNVILMLKLISVMQSNPAGKGGYRKQASVSANNLSNV